MKIESLNIWGGRVFDPLISHIKTESRDVDVFCFQEVYDTSTDVIHTRTILGDDAADGKLTNSNGARANIYQELVASLPDHIGYFHPAQDRMDFHGEVDFDLRFGQATFVRSGIPVMETGDIFVHGTRNGMVEGEWETLPKNLQFVQIQHNRRPLTIANFHGIHGSGKLDTPNRIEQAKRVKSFLDSQEGEWVICGDFNLLPDTRSLSIIEGGMRNLIKDYGVKSTRSDYYGKPIPFADYVIVSPEVEVIDFTVPQIVVSDHLPLLLEIK